MKGLFVTALLVVSSLGMGTAEAHDGHHILPIDRFLFHLPFSSVRTSSRICCTF